MAIANKEIFQKYCCGCGLCHSVNRTEMDVDEKGFPHAILSGQDVKWCIHICPAGSENARKQMQLLKDLWGDTEKVLLGWSNDSYVRRTASSGGVLSELCIYLLDHHIVDGIIQTRAGKVSIETETVISRTREDILSCAGSRYSISSPLMNLKQMIHGDESYAFVGKPCDVSALKMYLRQDEKLKNQIKYCFSFFCAGEPSRSSNEVLLSELGSDCSCCVNLTYRGNGWPGNTSVTNKDGSGQAMSYENSWGRILGRDIRPFCRFCMDGIGLLADISCGDAWYMTDAGEPDFSENEGRNVIFARTPIGAALVEEAEKENYIQVVNYNNYQNELCHIQRYQYERKATMYSMLCALMFFRKAAPCYDMRELRSFFTKVPIKKQVRKFLGTCKRIMNGKI